ncbi:hypothetical protein CGSHi7P49H1_02794, partial [Haemophilus influenzae 7P49H1]
EGAHSPLSIKVKKKISPGEKKEGYSPHQKVFFLGGGGVGKLEWGV